jgi:hypothetical protein
MQRSEIREIGATNSRISLRCMRATPGVAAGADAGRGIRKSERTARGEEHVGRARDRVDGAVEKAGVAGGLAGRLGARLGAGKARRKARRKARKEGEAALLLRLLERRFGKLNEERGRKLRAADAETLLIWGDRLLTAATAEEVLKD